MLDARAVDGAAAEHGPSHSKSRNKTQPGRTLVRFGLLGLVLIVLLVAALMQNAVVGGLGGLLLIVLLIVLLTGHV
jgi:hypothetical protein